MNRKVKIISIVILFSMMFNIICAQTPAYADKAPAGALSDYLEKNLPEGYKGANIEKHEGAYYWMQPVKHTYKFDFSVTRKSYYTTHRVLKIRNEAGFELTDGVMKSDKSSYTLSSTVGLGDDYGLEKGYAAFDLQFTEGTMYVGVRTSEAAVTYEARGLWFAFDGSNTLKITEPECGFEASVPIECDFKSAKRVIIYDNVDTIIAECDGKTVAKVQYNKDGLLMVQDKDGNVAGSTQKSKLYTSGYVQLCAMRMTGYIDNFEFTNVVLDDNLYTDGTIRDIDYSTWIATDALNRTTVMNDKTGNERDGKYVGVFYFLCWVGAGQVVQDHTKNYLKYGIEGFNKIFANKKGGEAYWAEPYFGYYRNTDAWVYRKHAYMLEAAGVDFIYLDVSNAEVFIQGHMTLFDTWLRIRKEGGMTPQIAFLTGDNSKTFEKDMSELFKTVYSEDNWEKYEELFFKVDGKPLVFGNISGVSAEMSKKINDKFTVRGNWAWTDKDGYWNWLQEYTYDASSGKYGLINGGLGRDEKGKFESLAISMGHHPTTNKGRSFVYGNEPNNGKGDYEFSSVERAGLGLNFESQFKAAMSFDPDYLLITGWNEWIAGCSYDKNMEKSQIFCNTTSYFWYVDQFNVEFSRDGEPMRNVGDYGIGDNYYYQMIDYIRQYKGIRQTPVADNQQTIDMYDINEWNNIKLSYMDTIGDTKLRNTVCYDDSYRYINNSGRNDFDYAKVSQDSSYMYFMVKCVNNIVVDNASNWMNLYIGTDENHSNGWGGFEYAVNRSRDSFMMTVEKFKDGSFEGEAVGAADYYIQGKYLVVRIDKKVLGIENTAKSLYFKWADNSTYRGDMMEFMDMGDTAPNDRYSFVYKAESCSDAKFDKSKTPIIQEPVIKRPEPDLKPDIDVDENGMHTVDVLFDFESDSAGESIKDVSAGDTFELATGNTTSGAVLTKENDNIYIVQSGFTDLRTWYDIEGAYEFSADIRLVDSGSLALFIRGEMPGLFTPHNPAHSAAAGQDVNQTFNYFEVDWYAENNGKEGGSSLGGSGIGIYPGAQELNLSVKRYVTDGLTVAAKEVKIKYPEGVSVDNGFFNLKVEDDANEIKLTINGILVARIVLEQPGVVYETDETGNEYYGKVTVYDAAGKMCASVENTRLNSRGSQIAFTTRNKTIHYDNLYIAYKEQLPIGGDVVKELVEINDNKPFAPDTSFTGRYYTIPSALGHTHTYEEKWLSDELYHWLACSGCDEKKQYEIHTYDASCDADCNVCGYKRSAVKHAYKKEWSSDSKEHWHECEDCGSRIDVNTHKLSSEKNECSICGAAMDNAPEKGIIKKIVIIGVAIIAAAAAAACIIIVKKKK